MNKIVQIRVFKMWESCQRTTFFVELTTEEGFTMTPASYRTGDIYNNFEGLSLEVARDRALIDAHGWGDFLLVPVDPYQDDEGNVIEPSMTFDSYKMRREMAHRKATKSSNPVTK